MTDYMNQVPAFPGAGPSRRGPRKRSADENAPTNEQAARFDMLLPMIVSAHREMSELSKKKQDGIVNTLKVRHINRLLSPIQKILAGHESAGYLELLEEETLPQNSDAVFILGQFLAAMDQFQKRHTDGPYGGRRWRTVELLAGEDEHDPDDGDEDDYEDDPG